MSAGTFQTSRTFDSKQEPCQEGLLHCEKENALLAEQRSPHRENKGKTYDAYQDHVMDTVLNRPNKPHNIALEHTNHLEDEIR